jgi:hypothetical protein
MSASTLVSHKFTHCALRSDLANIAGAEDFMKICARSMSTCAPWPR